VRRERGRDPQAVVMCPTRELAQQVMREIDETCPGRFRGVCLYGGQSYRESNNALRMGVDYVVATPGRLMDNLQSGHLDISGVEYFVLDEADQMLDMGFSDDVEEVLGYIEKKAQTMLFSATMPGWVKSLADRYTENAVTIDLVGDTKQKAASTIDFKALAIPGRKGGEQRDAKASIPTGGGVIPCRRPGQDLRKRRPGSRRSLHRRRAFARRQVRCRASAQESLGCRHRLHEAA
jgi:superfamily II DNA/RNA helicase